MTLIRLDSVPCPGSFDMVKVSDLVDSAFVPGRPLVATLVDDHSGVQLTVEVVGNLSVASFFRLGRIGLDVRRVVDSFDAPMADGGAVKVLLLEDGSRSAVADVGDSSPLWPLVGPPSPGMEPDGADRSFTVTVDVPQDLLANPARPDAVIRWKVDPVVGDAVSNSSRWSRRDDWHTRSAWPYVEVTNGGGTVVVNGVEYGAGYVKGPDFTVFLGKLYGSAKYVTYDVTAAF